jgi:5-methylthioadenosine/S-adenosylhomocysteine deaminase
MTSRTEVDTILCGSAVLTMAEPSAVVSDGAVAISAGKIVGVGPRAEILDAFCSQKIIDDPTAIILPGLVNTHAHAAMTLFRGSADDRDLGQFLNTVWDLEKKYVSPDAVKIGALVGLGEMALSGVTACADMYWHPDSTVAAATDIGIRIATGAIYIDFEGVDEHVNWESRIAAGIEFIQRHQHNAMVTPLLCPHAVYSASMDQLAELGELAKRLDVGIHIHAAEAAHEVNLVKDKTGLSPVRALQATGILDAKSWLAHAVHVDEEEIELLAATGTGVAHCPLSNMKLASGIAPVTQYLKAGVKLGLGTDGPSSSNDLNLWAAMRVAGLLQKVSLSDPEAFTAQEIVKTATIGGARVLSIDETTGSLEVGKGADVIMVTCDNLHGSCVYDPYSHLVYAARPGDVTHVYVNGDAVVENGVLVNVDTQEILKEFRSTLACCV